MQLKELELDRPQTSVMRNRARKRGQDAILCLSRLASAEKTTLSLGKKTFLSSIADHVLMSMARPCIKGAALDSLRIARILSTNCINLPASLVTRKAMAAHYGITWY